MRSPTSGCGMRSGRISTIRTGRCMVVRVVVIAANGSAGEPEGIG